MRDAARRRFTLDHYLSYYISLRQQLMPLSGHGEIIDADTAPPDLDEMPVNHPMPQSLPADVHWVSVELGDDIAWPLPAISGGKDLGQVIDRESLLRILQALSSASPPALAVAVAQANRSR